MRGMNEMPPITLKHRLRMAREHAGLEQSHLAMALGISRNTIGRWESGSHVPTLGMIKQWAAETGVSLGYLLGDEVAETIPATLERRRNAQTRQQRRGGSEVITTTEPPAADPARDKSPGKQAVRALYLVAA